MGGPGNYVVYLYCDHFSLGEGSLTETTRRGRREEGARAQAQDDR